MKLSKLVLSLLTTGLICECALSFDKTTPSPAPRSQENVLGTPTRTFQNDESKSPAARELMFGSPSILQETSGQSSQVVRRTKLFSYEKNGVLNAHTTSKNEETKTIVESAYAKKAKACWSGFEATRAGQKIIPVLVVAREWVGIPL